jgi:hypothetical protein
LVDASLKLSNCTASQLEDSPAMPPAETTPTAACSAFRGREVSTTSRQGASLWLQARYHRQTSLTRNLPNWSVALYAVAPDCRAAGQIEVIFDGRIRMIMASQWPLHLAKLIHGGWRTPCRRGRPAPWRRRTRAAACASRPPRPWPGPHRLPGSCRPPEDNLEQFGPSDNCSKPLQYVLDRSTPNRTALKLTSTRKAPPLSAETCRARRTRRT